MSTDLGPYCIQYTEFRLPKNISRQNSRQQKIGGQAFFDSTIYTCNYFQSCFFQSTMCILRVQDESHQEKYNRFASIDPYCMKYTVKPVSICHSQKDQKLVFKTNNRLMWVKSIAECSKRAFCNTFDLH